MINKENIISVKKIFNENGIFYSYNVIFNVDKICIVPLDEANTDYQAIQEWIVNGGQVIDNGE